MPYDGQGVFTRVHNWEEDAANDISILASRHDAEDDNFANGFNEVLCRDGRAAMTGNLKMGANKITGLANGTNTNDAVNLGQLNSTSSTLSTAINSKANASDVVKLTENQTVAGVKTFSSSPVVPTPANSDNSTKAATTAFIKSYIAAALVPDYSAMTSISSGYTATKNGVVYLTQSQGNVATTVAIDGHNILYMNGHSGSSHGQPRPCATAIIGAGQKITFSNIQYAYFVPFSY